MAETWKSNPPFAHWKGYSKSLQKYADDLLAKSEIPSGRTLAQWYALHADELHNTATKRKLNSIVARALLPLFEATPEHWESVSYLNDGRPSGAQPFEEFLTDWHQNAPEKHRAFIRRVAQQFGIELAKAKTPAKP